jgi:hypothetical protein
LILGIDVDSPEYWNHVELYEMFVSEKCEPKSPQATVESMLVKDVYRTFGKLKLFTENTGSGKNKLFNVLKAYSLYDPEIGYT